MPLADDLKRDARRVAKLPGELTDVAAKQYAKALRRRVANDAGPDRRLSGMGSAARALDVDIVTRRRGDKTTTSVFAGPKQMRRGWAWLQSGTKPRRQGRRGRHPGTKPKRTFSEPVTQVTPDVLAAVDRTFHNTPL